MTCTTAQSGTLSSFIMFPEATCGTPRPLTTVSSVATNKTGSVFKFTRGAGSWVTDGFELGMEVLAAGFVDTDINAYWKVVGVTTTDLTVDDLLGVGSTEASGGGKTIAMVFSTMRLTSPRSLTEESETLESDEVRPSRQITDVRKGFTSVGGSIGFEMSIRSHTMLLASALGGVWTTPVVTGTPNLAIASATPSAGYGRVTRATGSFITDGLRKGDVVTFAAFANAANNVQRQLTAVTATTVTYADSAATTVTEVSGAGPTLTFVGYRMDSGTNLQTVTVERRFNSITTYDAFYGMCVNEFGIDASAKSKVTGTATLLGMSKTAKGNTSIATTGIAPLASTGFQTSLANASIYEAGTQNAFVTNLTVNVANNRTTEAVIGSNFAPFISEGRCRISGNLTFFLTDEVQSNKFFYEEESSLFFRLQDPTDPNGFLAVTIPRIKYTTDNIDPPQENSVPVSMDFVGLGADLANPSGATIESSFTLQVSSL